MDTHSRSRTPERPSASSWPPLGEGVGSVASAPSSSSLPTATATATATFTSTFSAFNLPAPRTRETPASPAGMQVDPIDSYPLYHRRLAPNLASSPSATSQPAPMLFAPLPGPSPFPFRKQSTLAQEPLLPSVPVDESNDDDDEVEDDESMILGSPAFTTASLPPFHSLIGRQSRSRSASDAQSQSQASIPASPVMIARALQGQRTPPPMFQRRLYNEMQEDDQSSSNSPAGSSTSGSNSGLSTAQLAPMQADDDEERDSVSMGLGLAVGGGSGSGSGSEENGRVVRRAVSRKPNLLPKPKSHLRVLADLRNEDGPADQLEIASEATLHRLSRSGASTVPGLRPTPTMLPSTSTPDGARPPSSHGLATRPTPNRFPDGTDDPDEDRASSSSNDEGEDGGEAGSDWGGMSLGGYGTEDEEERRASIWTGIRGAGMGGPGMSAASTASMSAGGKSPGSERGRMEIETNSPSTPGWHTSARPGKRKMTNDERFEPYAQAFKRRAVSPASGGSPILSLPNPPPPTSLTLPPSHTLPIAIPSPTLGPHHSFFSTISSGMRSRAGSPVASSLSSSAGRGPGGFFGGNPSLGMVMSGRAERDEERSGTKASETTEGLGSMSLG